MSFRLEAALQGNLEAFQSGVRTAWLQAGRDTMEVMRERGLSRLRGSVQRAGLGARLANTWRGNIYPERGLSDDPALVLFSKAPEIIKAHEGETIHAKAGSLLAIPIPGSPAEDFKVQKGTKVEYARRKFGDRLFVIPPVAGRPAILAIEGGAISATGKLSARKKLKSGQYGKGAATIFLFWLVPEVTLGARLDVDADFAAIGRMLASEFEKVLGAHLLRAGLSERH